MHFWVINLPLKIGIFQFFSKILKVVILFYKFLHENCADRKNWVHHDKANEKSFETIISDFWILKLCHRDFSPQSSLILEKNWFSHFMIRIFKETITAFKRINRFSIYQYQNQKDKGPEILVYLVALTKNFDKIFLALQKSRFTQNFPQNLQFRRSLKKPSQLLHGLTDFQYQYVKIKMIKARKFWYIWKVWQKILQIFFGASKNSSYLKFSAECLSLPRCTPLK